MTEYRDKQTLERLYWGENMSTYEMGDELGCDQATIFYWMDKHGIDRRGQKEASERSLRSRPAGFTTDKRGYESWFAKSHDDSWQVRVHRLLAVAEYGFDAVKDKEVHHKIPIPWLNTHSNIEPLSPREHRDRHSDISDLDRIRIAELYENGDASQRVVGEVTGVAQGTVSAYHREFYGGAD